MTDELPDFETVLAHKGDRCICCKIRLSKETGIGFAGERGPMCGDCLMQ